MKNLLSAFRIIPAHAEEIYDPQHTMLALNMAVVSVHRILSTEDRIVLEQEYQNIINNLSLGNIESDKDMTILYRDLLRIISRKRLREEDREFLRGRYDRMEQKLLKSTLGGVKSSGRGILTLVGGLAVSCISSYFSYKYSRSELAEGLSGELWQLTKEDITDCNALQERLLNSSWNLLRQYKLPEKYRLVQRVLDDFYKAVNEQDNAKRLRMLRALERDFQVYPPYWLYRGKTAQELGNIHEANTYFERFNEVWRPVLRKDPYKVEALKFGLSEIVKGENLSDEEKRRAIGLLEVMTENTPRDDWANNIFAGVAYFVLGDKDRGIEIVETNVDFGYGADVSEVILTQLKADELNPAKLSSELAGLLTPSVIDNGKFTGEVKDKQLAEALIMYFEGMENEAKKALEIMSRTSRNPVVFHAFHWMNLCKAKGYQYSGFMVTMKGYTKPLTLLGHVFNLRSNYREAFDEAYAEVKTLIEFYAEKRVPSAQFFLGVMYDCGYGVKTDKAEAIKWCCEAAKQGHAIARNYLGNIYSSEGDLTKAVFWYRKAAEQGHAMAQESLGYRYKNGYGVYQDYKIAYMWYSLATLFGLDCTRQLDKIEKGGFFSLPKISPSEAKEAKAEAQRKYDEIRKRYGLD